MFEIQHKEFEDGSYVRLFTDLQTEIEVDCQSQLEDIITPWIKLPINGEYILSNIYRCSSCGEILEDDGHTSIFDCPDEKCFESGADCCWPIDRFWTNLIFYQDRWREEWTEERFIAAYPYVNKKK